MKFAIGLLLSLAIATPTDPQRHRTNQSSNETNDAVSNAVSSSSTPSILDIEIGNAEAVPPDATSARIPIAEEYDIEALKQSIQALETQIDELSARPDGNECITMSMISQVRAAINRIKRDLLVYHVVDLVASTTLATTMLLELVISCTLPKRIDGSH